MRRSHLKQPLRTPPCDVENRTLHQHHTPAPWHPPPPPKNTHPAAAAAAQPPPGAMPANTAAAVALAPLRGALGGAAGWGLAGKLTLEKGPPWRFGFSTQRGYAGVGFGRRLHLH